MSDNPLQPAAVCKCPLCYKYVPAVVAPDATADEKHLHDAESGYCRECVEFGRLDERINIARDEYRESKSGKAEKPSPDYTALIALIRRPVGELPCSTKEMKPREHAIYLLLAKSLGNISFVADVLEAVSAPAPGCVSPALTDAREAAIEAIHPIIYADALEQFGEADVHECHEFATRIADAILPIFSSFTLTHPEDAALGFAITSLEIHDCLQHAGVVQGLRARLRASDTAEGEKA